MSNADISIRPSYLTAAAPADAFAENLGFAQPARISMQNDRFNVLDGNGQAVLPPSLNLQVIMLWENDTRVYYSGVWDPENPSPPACYSDNKVTPSVSAMQPQNDLCATCPRAVWDQPTPRGNLVPACKNQYKIACLVAGAHGAVFLLTIPPASRKAYEQYRKFLRSHNARPEQVITKLDYADKAFQFSFQVWINEATDAMVNRVFESDEPAMIVNAYDKPGRTLLPLPKVAKIASSFVIDGPPEGIIPPNPKRPPPNANEPGVGAEPPKRRGRPPKVQETVVGPGPIPPAAFAESSTPPAPPPAPKQGNGGGFGMEAAQKPPADIQEALNRAFGP